MPSVYESRFEIQAAQRGHRSYSKGWPDRLLLMGKEVLFVEVKGEGEPLRPHQWEILQVLKTLGLRVVIAVNGDLDNLVDPDDWMVTASARGRPPQMGTISKATARSYMYKALALRSQAEEAKKDPNFSQDYVRDLERRATALELKAKQYWGSEIEEKLVTDAINMGVHKSKIQKSEESLMEMNKMVEKENAREDEKRRLAEEEYHRKQEGE